MSDLALEGVAYAEAQWGTWMARCPRPGCTNALGLVVGQDLFVCEGGHACGLVAPVVWPADPQAIETVLLMRPLPANRNWLAGETVEQLLAENAEHGCLPLAWSALAEASPDRKALLVKTVEGRVVGGLLHQELEAAGRREIGA